jgi:hypothetical protein
VEQIELEPARHSVPTSLFATPHPPIRYEPAVLLLLYSRRKKLFGKADDPYVATTQVRWHVVTQRSGTPWLSVSLAAWQPWLCPVDSRYVVDARIMHHGWPESELCRPPMGFCTWTMGSLRGGGRWKSWFASCY